MTFLTISLLKSVFNYLWFIYQVRRFPYSHVLYRLYVFLWKKWNFLKKSSIKRQISFLLSLRTTRHIVITLFDMLFVIVSFLFTFTSMWGYFQIVTYIHYYHRIVSDCSIRTYTIWYLVSDFYFAQYLLSSPCYISNLIKGFEWLTLWPPFHLLCTLLIFYISFHFLNWRCINYRCDLYYTIGCDISVNR